MLWKTSKQRSKDTILQSARDNAIEDCRKIIDALPKENPSLGHMINPCAKVGTSSHNMGMLANIITASVKSTPQCYKSGQQGHLKRFPESSLREHTLVYTETILDGGMHNQVLLLGTSALPQELTKKNPILYSCTALKTPQSSSPPLPVPFQTDKSLFDDRQNKLEKDRSLWPFLRQTSRTGKL
ncbi:hypothetical protein Nmel_010669, partial [Mimus melanotis]